MCAVLPSQALLGVPHTLVLPQPLSVINSFFIFRVTLFSYTFCPHVSLKQCWNWYNNQANNSKQPRTPQLNKSNWWKLKLVKFPLKRSYTWISIFILQNWTTHSKSDQDWEASKIDQIWYVRQFSHLANKNMKRKKYWRELENMNSKRKKTNCMADCEMRSVSKGSKRRYNWRWVHGR